MAFTLTQAMDTQTEVSVDIEKVITQKAKQPEHSFRHYSTKPTRSTPQPKDVKALAELVSGDMKLELWRGVSAGHLARADGY